MIYTLLVVVALAAVGKIIVFLKEAWSARSLMQGLQRLGKPMLPHHPVLGHLLEAQKSSEAIPGEAHSSYILHDMGKRLGTTEAYYFDPFPVAEPLLVVLDPYLCNQLVAHPQAGTQKPTTLESWFAPISGRGGRNLFTENGQEWKDNHDLFMPFFNNTNLDGAMPMILGHMETFREILRDRARTGGLFHLEPLTLSLMNDIIGRIVFNADLRNQTSDSPHPLSKTMLRQLQLKFGTGPVPSGWSLNPLSKFEHWNNNRLLNVHIRNQIHERANSFRNNTDTSSSEGSEDNAFRSLLDQALETYYSSPKYGGGRSTTAPPPDSSSKQQQFPPLDPSFLEMLCAELRMFFFAGYDSTSSTIVSCIYALSTHPQILTKLRSEHDSIFGPLSSSTSSPSPSPSEIISSNPTILNSSLPYTTAVIKETMRLFPPASGIRPGNQDLELVSRDGKTTYPTRGCSVQMNHLSIHRHEGSWGPEAGEFIPERFLTTEGGGLGLPPKGAWRPFEYGTRLCPGQALVMKEVKAFLVLFAREFDFEECYDEVFFSGTKEKGEKEKKLANVFGEKAYQVAAGAAHLRGEFPCRVRLNSSADMSRVE